MGATHHLSVSACASPSGAPSHHTTRLVLCFVAPAILVVSDHSTLSSGAQSLPLVYRDVLNLLYTFTYYTETRPWPPTVCTHFCGASTYLLPCLLSVHVVLIVLSVRASSRPLSSNALVCDLFPRRLSSLLLSGHSRWASQSQSQRSLLGRTSGIYGALGGHHSDESLRSLEVRVKLVIPRMQASPQTSQTFLPTKGSTTRIHQHK